MEKYILSDEDVRNLSSEQQKQYNSFWGAIHDSGIVYPAQLQYFAEILRQQYRLGVLFNPNDLERYPQILSKNINSVIDAITQVRNDVINGKRVFEQANFQRIDEGLDVLKNFVEINLQNPHYKNSIGHYDLESVLPRIDQLKGQLSQDMTFYPKYNDEKASAIADYRSKQAAYNRLSLFGKLAARINGKKKELTEAQLKNDYYYGEEIRYKMPQPGDIINPYKYNDYLERQQVEQSTGDMRR